MDAPHGVLLVDAALDNGRLAIQARGCARQPALVVMTQQPKSCVLRPPSKCPNAGAKIPGRCVVLVSTKLVAEGLLPSAMTGWS